MSTYTAATGMNLPPNDTRYEAGDEIPASSIEQWMLDQGVVLVDGESHAVETPTEPEPEVEAEQTDDAEPDESNEEAEQVEPIATDETPVPVSGDGEAVLDADDGEG